MKWTTAKLIKVDSQRNNVKQKWQVSEEYILQFHFHKVHITFKTKYIIEEYIYIW